MSSQWFRFYNDVLNDPKVQQLPPDLFKHWVNLLCIASKHDGVLPDLCDVTFALRCDETTVTTVLERLHNGGLIDRVNGGGNGWRYAPHGWDKRQFKSDTSKERTQRYRDRRRDVTVTPPEQIQNRTEDTTLRSVSPPAVPQRIEKQKPNLSRLPFDALPPDWDDWAHAAMGWDVAVTADVWAAFRDYWQAKTGKTAMKSDWFATWRNWCRSERPKGKNHEQRTGNRQPHDVFGSAWAGAAADLARTGRH